MLSSELTARWKEVRRATPTSMSAGGASAAEAEISVGSADAPSALRDAWQPPAELARGLEIETPRGPCWRIDLPLAEVWPEQERWLAALARRAPLASDEPAGVVHPEIAALQKALPERVLLLDVEACGDNVFLVGLLHTCDGQPLVTQLLARHSGEEAALLAALAGIRREKEVLVTFNGKTIDGPLLAERSRLHELDGAGAPPAAIHCDLLHHARRRWKDRLPNCKLQTLEQYICGRQRGEVPVRDVAQAYDDYLAGNARPLHNVLDNNMHELVTLWQLALWLAHG